VRDAGASALILFRHAAMAHWVEHVNTIDRRPAMQDWLTNRDSLTARLTARCTQFRVQRLSRTRRCVCRMSTL
jgi:chorismate--pyruvate lyase